MKKIKLFTILLCLTMILAACGSDADVTQSTATKEAVVTEAPSKSVPVVLPTVEPTSEVTTEVPTSEVPTSEVPSSEVPTTEVPTSEKSSEVTTAQSTTHAPTPTPPEGSELNKMIALTFDDGPATNGAVKDYPAVNNSSTSRILDVLEQYGAKATFFVQGVNMDYAEFKTRNSEIVKREADLGMQIGCHSYDHPNFNKMSNDEIDAQVKKCCEMIKDATGGYEVTIVRTPYGAEKASTLAAVDYPVIIWNIDTLDWDTKDADNTYNEIMKKIKGGSIVLMHDIYQATADAVEMVVPALIEAGYKLVTIDELFEAYGVELKPHTAYYSVYEYHN